MVIMMAVASSEKIMGTLKISGRLRALGWLCTAAMAVAVLAMFGASLIG
jgi:Mn2+/Fe2+ NRAMP family transporter